MPPRSRTTVTQPTCGRLAGAGQMHVLGPVDMTAFRKPPGIVRPTTGAPAATTRPVGLDGQQIGRADEIGDEGVGGFAVNLNGRATCRMRPSPITTTRSAMVIASR